MNTKWTRRCREDASLVHVKETKKKRKDDSFCHFLKITRLVFNPLTPE